MLGAFTSSLSSFSFPGPMRDAAVGDCNFCVSVPTISHPSVSTSCLNSCEDALCSSAAVFCSCTSTRIVAGLTLDFGRMDHLESISQGLNRLYLHRHPDAGARLAGPWQ